MKDGELKGEEEDFPSSRHGTCDRTRYMWRIQVFTRGQCGWAGVGQSGAYAGEEKGGRIAQDAWGHGRDVLYPKHSGEPERVLSRGRT